MSLPAFDVEKHQVGLGATAGSEKGLVIAGAYRKAYRRDLSDELQGVHYGADSLFNQPGLSSWTQDDFTGGGWQQVWGKDQAMFSSCSSFLPAQFDRSLRTVPPLTLRAASGDGGGLYGGKPLAMFIHGGWVVTVWSDRIYRYDPNSGAAAEVFLERPIPSYVYDHAVYDRRLGIVIASTVSPVTGGTALVALDPLSGAAWGHSSLEPGELAGGTCTGMDVDGDRMVVAVGNTIWTSQMGNRASDAIATDWVRVGRLPASWRASCWMGQQLYILCGTGEGNASLVSFDGVQLLPVTEFQFNFYGQSLCAYAGRIYVGGAGLDIAGGVAYAELHEVTGSSVRLVKTFAPERDSGRYQAPSSIYSMVVHEGLLFFGQTGQGLIAYDVTTDSLYGAHIFDPGRVNSGRVVTELVSGRGRIWAYVPHSGASGDNGIWAGIVAGDAGPLNGYSGILDTSEFGPELDRMKRWKKLRLLTRGDASETIPIVYASLDGGLTWATAPYLSTEQAGVSVLRTYDLEGIASSHSVRFRLVLPRFGSPTAGYSELVAFSASFQLVDTDNLHTDGTEKLAWNFAVAGVECVELEDGTASFQRLGELGSTLWDWARNRAQLSFVDQDGERYDVKIDSLSETQPQVLPPVVYDDPASATADSGREAFYALTLVEA